ncbi:MAG: hypothetical protein PHU33_15925, partial [Bacteroidales bacterium]|nr:hypothetical protein [Bacteroidales bacterium]
MSSFIPKPAGAATMALQREVWLPSLQEQYEQQRDWMNEMQDLSVFVDNNQVLHFAEIGDYPTVYKNRTTDVDSVEPTETPNEVSLDTYDSQNYKIRKSGLAGIPYAKVEAYTRQSAEAIRLKEASATAFLLTPDADSGAGKKIILPTTGTNNGNGYKQCTISDIQALAEAMDLLKFPGAEKGRTLVLRSKMWWELVKTNDILKAQIQFQQVPGMIKIPNMVEYYGFKIYKYDPSVDVGYNVETDLKAAEGTLLSSTIVPMAFAFCKPEAWSAGGIFDLFDKPIRTNTTGRAYEFGFQHRFKAGLFRTAYKYSAALYHCP